MSELDILKQQMNDLLKQNNELLNQQKQIKDTFTNEIQHRKTKKKQITNSFTHQLNQTVSQLNQSMKMKQEQDQVVNTLQNDLNQLQTKIKTQNKEKLAQSVRKPKTFGGTKDQNIEIFLDEFERYASVVGITNDFDKTRVLEAYMTDNASTYLQSIRGTYTTFSGFKTLLKNRFQPVSSNKLARLELKKLRQNLLTVSEYSNQFLSIANRITDMTEADRIEKYKDGLNFKIQQAIAVFETTTLTDTMIHAERVVAVHLKPNNHFKSQSTSQTPSSNSTGQTTAPSTSTATPMQLDVIKCEYCGRRGHTKQTCYKIIGYPSQRSGRSNLNAMTQDDAAHHENVDPA